jgi:hypothetical protein
MYMNEFSAGNVDYTTATSQEILTGKKLHLPGKGRQVRHGASKALA